MDITRFMLLCKGYRIPVQRLSPRQPAALQVRVLYMPSRAVYLAIRPSFAMHNNATFLLGKSAIMAR